MDKSRVSFLNEFNSNLISHINETSTFSDVKKLFSLKEFKIYTLFDFDDIKNHLNEIKLVLEKITSIIYNPIVKTSTEETIIRSELATNLSSKAFLDTIKDSRLWKRKDEKMTPEFVHSVQYVDSQVTYENKFIAKLIDYIYLDLKNIIKNINPNSKSIESEYELVGTRFNKRFLTNKVEEIGKPIKFDLVYDQNDDSSTLNLAKKLYSDIKKCKLTELYKLNSKNKLPQALEATNILIHNNLYSYCYKFYLSNYLYKTSLDDDLTDLYYYNYVVSLMLNFLKDDIKDASKIYLKDNKLRFNKLEIKKGLFEFTITDNDENLSINITSILKEDTKINKISYSYLLSYQLSESNYKVLEELASNLFKESDDCILITQNNLLNKFDHVMNISIFDKEHIQIKNMFTLSSLLLDCNTELYNYVCPICGSKNISNLDSKIVCHDCHGKSDIVTINKKKYLWIKTFRRL